MPDSAHLEGAFIELPHHPFGRVCGLMESTGSMMVGQPTSRLERSEYGNTADLATHEWMSHVHAVKMLAFHCARNSEVQRIEIAHH